MARGLVRETVSLAIWLAAFLSASMFAESTMNFIQFGWMEGLSEPAQQAFRYSGAFTAIFVGILVIGAIVHSHHFEIRQRLRPQAVKRFGEGSLRVVDRYQY